MKKKLSWIIPVAVLLLVGIYFGYSYWQRIQAINTTMDEDEESVLLIPTGATYQDVLDSLRAGDILKKEKNFDWVAQKKNYPSLVKPGRYVLKGGMSNNELVNKLRSGDQTPLRLTLHDISGIFELAGKLGRQLEPDSISFLHLFQSEDALSAFGVNSHNVTAYFLPNTYEVWWNTSPTAFLRRMHREFDKYWTPARQQKAQQLNLTPIEVVVLASIVERETVKSDEKPTVAGLYINRLKRGMKLQSDPTVIFGIRRDHPHRRITRVLYSDLDYASPYNTYIHTGIPPGPIKIPALSSIEAVLNHEQHNYIYMAADPERPGYHNFASNYRQHQINAAKYRRWASDNNI